MKKFISFLFIGLTFLSCQEVIELDLEAPKPELVIEGYLADLDFYLPDGDLVCSPEQVIPEDTVLYYAQLAEFFPIDSVEKAADYFPYNKVKLSTTSAYFDSAPAPRVSGALVRLYENGSLVETLSEDSNSPGIYRITHDPVVGAKYHLYVEALGNTYETTPEVYRPTPPIIGTKTEYVENPPFGDSAGFYLRINTYEVPGAGDHYRWTFYINSAYQSDPFNISIANDDGIDGACVPGFDVYGDRLETGDTIVVFQSRISQKHFDFLTNLRQQTAFVGSPFDTPPAPIVGNVKNITTGKDAYGYFLPASVSAGAAVVPTSNP